MTIKLLFSFLILATLSGCNTLNAQTCGKGANLIKTLDKYHYRPVVYNDSISGEIFDKFILTLDPYSLYFIQDDINELKPYRNNIHNEMQNRSCIFLNKATSVYKKRLTEAIATIQKILEQPFDYNLRDSIVFSNENENKYAINQAELEKRWRKWLKYEMLAYLFTPLDTNDKPFVIEINKLMEREPQTRNKLKIKETRFAERILNHPSGYENYVQSVFLNTVAQRYDPHTNYFSYNEKENFLTSLSAESLSFGVSFSEKENGEVQVERLVPGGPAWKSNELHKGDVLLKIKFPESTATDLSYSDLYEVEEMIASSKSNRMDLTVRKISGSVQNITLIKEKLRDDENLIKSYILNGKNKVGYISLPDFYTDWNTVQALGCANDVAKEILKLQQESIEGLILDVRFNGGGSVYEVINLAGIFINEGPLTILQQREQKPVIIKDLNRGTIYNGPLVLMVNGFSASASEILAGALQDYNRALIIGSTTFGKASGQVILPIDSYYQTNSEKGFVKVTTDRYYRITGTTHQQQGITPDITIPDLYGKLDFRESSLPYSFTSDTTPKKALYTSLPAIPVKDIAMNSKKRIEQDSIFKKITFIGDSLQQTIKNDRTVALDIKTYRKTEKQHYENTYSLEQMSARESTSFHVTSNIADAEIFKLDEHRKEVNEVFLKNIGEDIYIEEAFYIISDLINIGKH